MQVTFDKNQRKAVAHALGEIIGAEVKYLGVPSCAYQVGDYLMEADGKIEIEDGAILDALAKKGFTPVEKVALTIHVEGEYNEKTIGNLRQIIENKSNLFKAAFRTEDLHFDADDKGISFPWFTLDEPSEAMLFADFCSHLVSFAEEQSRVNKKHDDSDNQKFAMRTFLNRIGMVGDDFKSARKVILRHLTGSSAFRFGRKSNDDTKRD